MKTVDGVKALQTGGQSLTALAVEVSLSASGPSRSNCGNANWGSRDERGDDGEECPKLPTSPGWLEEESEENKQQVDHRGDEY